MTFLLRRHRFRSLQKRQNSSSNMNNSVSDETRRMLEDEHFAAVRAELAEAEKFWLCANCNQYVSLNKSGRCENCNSDSLAYVGRRELPCQEKNQLQS